jgi:hypothetical protein
MKMKQLDNLITDAVGDLDRGGPLMGMYCDEDNINTKEWSGVIRALKNLKKEMEKFNARRAS